MADVIRNFIHKKKTETGWEILYPATTAGQVITDENNKFVTQAQITAFEGKAEVAAVTQALADAKAYSDTAIANLVDTAPEQLDTLKELADAVQATDGALDGLLAVVGEKATKVELQAHIDNKENPHGVTAAQVGLGNVDNTADADKPVSTATAAALALKADANKIQTTTVSDTEPVGVATGSFWYQVV